jgi:hypothetical protein
MTDKRVCPETVISFRDGLAPSRILPAEGREEKNRMKNQCCPITSSVQDVKIYPKRENVNSWMQSCHAL